MKRMPYAHQNAPFMYIRNKADFLAPRSHDMRGKFFTVRYQGCRHVSNTYPCDVCTASGVPRGFGASGSVLRKRTRPGCFRISRLHSRALPVIARLLLWPRPLGSVRVLPLVSSARLVTPSAEEARVELWLHALETWPKG